MEQLAALGLPSGQIEGGPQGVPPCGGDDGVHLRMDRAAQFIPLSAGHIHGLPSAVAQIHAVLPPPGRAVVPGGNDLVVLDDDGSVAPPQAGGALQHRLRDVQIVVLLVDPLHGRPPFFDSIAQFVRPRKTVYILFTIGSLTAAISRGIISTCQIDGSRFPEEALS